MKDIIAVIATTEDMYQAYKHILGDQNLSYPIFYARMQKALHLAHTLIEDGIKVIISWGRTASLLRKNVDITVISLRFSVQDYLNSLFRAFHHSRNVLYFDPNEEFTAIIPLLNNIFRSDIKYRNFDWDEMQDIDEAQARIINLLKEARESGIDVVIGGIALEKACLENNPGLIFIKNRFNEDAILHTLEEAQYAAQLAREATNRQLMRQKLLDSVSEVAIQTDSYGKISNFNHVASDHFGRGLSELNIRDLFPDFDLTLLQTTGEEGRPFILESKNGSYTIDLHPLVLNDIPTGAIIIAQLISSLQKKEQSLRLALSKKGLFAKTRFADLIWTCSRMEKLIEKAKRFASSQNTILITGESGTGKELFAQSIHNHSARSSGPFVAINCGALPPSILESELFGYVKGAFTGASSKGKPGIFELAHGGTLFLDEIGEMPMDLQVRLLRVIQEREVFRLGDDHVIPVDVRIITATNRDLRAEAAAGRFRDDLYYRISVLQLELPPLRERPDDIRILAQHFAEHNSEGKQIHLQQDLLNHLTGFSWPGNIRQLQNVVAELCVMAENDSISLAEAKTVFNFEILLPYNAADSEISENRSLDGRQIPTDSSFSFPSKAEVFLDALKKCRGSRKDAAKLLGISTATLWRHMKKLEAEYPDIFSAKYRYM